MKKFLLITVMLVFGLTFAVAQNQAEIKFDKVTYDFGTSLTTIQCTRQHSLSPMLAKLH